MLDVRCQMLDVPNVVHNGELGMQLYCYSNSNQFKIGRTPGNFIEESKTFYIITTRSSYLMEKIGNGKSHDTVPWPKKCAPPDLIKSIRTRIQLSHQFPNQINRGRFFAHEKGKEMGRRWSSLPAVFLWSELTISFPGNGKILPISLPFSKRLVCAMAIFPFQDLRIGLRIRKYMYKQTGKPSFNDYIQQKITKPHI